MINRGLKDLRGLLSAKPNIFRKSKLMGLDSVRPLYLTMNA